MVAIQVKLSNALLVSAQLGRISSIVGLNMPHTTNGAHHKCLHLCEVSNQWVNTTRPTIFASDVAMKVFKLCLQSSLLSDSSCMFISQVLIAVVYMIKSSWSLPRAYKSREPEVWESWAYPLAWDTIGIILQSNRCTHAHRNAFYIKNRTFETLKFQSFTKFSVFQQTLPFFSRAAIQQDLRQPPSIHSCIEALADLTQ